MSQCQVNAALHSKPVGTPVLYLNCARNYYPLDFLSVSALELEIMQIPQTEGAAGGSIEL